MITAAEFRRKLKAPFSGAFLFFGEEEYLKQNSLESCRTLIDPNPATSFNIQRFSAQSNDFSLRAVQDALLSPPFFAERKMIEVCDFNFNAAAEGVLSDWEKLFEACTPDDTLLIISATAEEFDAGTVKRPSKLATRFGNLLTLVAFEKETPARLAGWIARHFAAEHILITPAQCHALLDRCGHSMFILSHEIAKLCGYIQAQGRDRLEEEDIRLVTSSYAETEEFAFSNRILEGDTAGAYALLADMKAKKERPELILSSISGVFSDMCRIAVLTEASMTAKDIAGRLKLHEYKVSLYQKAIRGRSAERLHEILRRCSEADLKIKNSSVDSYIVIERLIASLGRK